MHPSVLEWFQRTLTAEDVAAKRVLEVGSFDVNGSVRPHVESLRPSQYHGVDAAPGPRVDQVVNCEQLVQTVGSGWDIVISTEMLEHVRDWRTCLLQMAEAVAPGGMLLITTRSPGFPYHPFPEDHWRYTPEFMGDVLETLDLKATVIPDPDPYSPGVFVLARKLECGWMPYRDILADLNAEPVAM